MDISLADERAYHFIPQFSLDIARDRVDQKKTNLVAGTMGALLSRPKPEEIQLVSTECRLEPFWLISVFVRTVYDRNHTYTLSLTGAEIQSVTLLGQDVAVDRSKGAPALSLPGVEHCKEEHRHQQTFDGLTGNKANLNSLLTFAKTEISDLEHFTPEGLLVIPPQSRATAVCRQMLAEVIKPVQAQAIQEEHVDIETIDLNFRPVYALEYAWAAKNKQVILEFDALTGDIRGGGKKLQDQIKNVVTRDFLFDVTADAVGMIVPGGGIAVKLVKAVVDRGKK